MKLTAEEFFREELNKEGFDPKISLSKTNITAEKGLRLAHKFASQFQQEITEEEIERMAKEAGESRYPVDTHTNPGVSPYVGTQRTFIQGFRSGAKEMLSYKMKQELPVVIKPVDELKRGDVFLWRSGMSGESQIHTFHSDAGYGAKTFTEYDERNESSVIVNYSGICGVLIPPPVTNKEEKE